MRNQFLKTAGQQAAFGLARRQTRPGGPFDIKLGAALLKDVRVPAQAKMLALLLGVAAVFVIDALEMPLEMVFAALLPVLGVGINIGVDGLEYVGGSLLIAAAFLPRIAPRDIVERIRSERDGGIPIPVEAHSRRR